LKQHPEIYSEEYEHPKSEKLAFWERFDGRSSEYESEMLTNAERCDVSV
jgi:hypothetical protein